MSSIPKSLEDYRDGMRERKELNSILQSLESQPKEFNLNMEIKFLYDQIDEVNRNLDKLEKKTSKIFSLLQKHNPRAHLYASLNFRCCYTWDEIAGLCNIESDSTVKAVVYRAFNDLRKQGYPLD